MRILRFEFKIKPFAKQSTRVASTTKKGKLRFYTSNKVRKKEKTLHIQLKEQLPKNFKKWDCPIRIKELTYVFSPLKSFTKKLKKRIENGELIYKSKKPDLTDNLSKAIMDCLEKEVVENDSRICDIEKNRKIYGNEPKIIIEIEPINQEVL